MSSSKGLQNEPFPGHISEAELFRRERAQFALAERAAQRLQALLNRGPIELVGHQFSDKDKYGRDLRVVRQGGGSVGDVLREEGLAHRYVGFKTSWC